MACRYSGIDSALAPTTNNEVRTYYSRCPRKIPLVLDDIINAAFAWDRKKLVQFESNDVLDKFTRWRWGRNCALLIRNAVYGPQVTLLTFRKLGSRVFELERFAINVPSESYSGFTGLYGYAGSGFNCWIGLRNLVGIRQSASCRPPRRRRISSLLPDSCFHRLQHQRQPQTNGAEPSTPALRSFAGRTSGPFSPARLSTFPSALRSSATRARMTWLTFTCAFSLEASARTIRSIA